jgi:hypothetical protein
MTAEPMYLVWSNKQNAWWGPGGRYYTQDLWEAQRYTIADAEHACQIRTQQPGKPSTEIAVRAPESGRPPLTDEELRYAPELMRRLVADVNRMDRRERAREEATR